MKNVFCRQKENFENHDAQGYTIQLEQKQKVTLIWNKAMETKVKFFVSEQTNDNLNYYCVF